MFDFFLDIGCFQGLDAGQRLAQGEGTCALANPGATLLMLSFGPSRWRWLVGGASQEEVETAFAGWEMLGSGVMWGVVPMGVKVEGIGYLDNHQTEPDIKVENEKEIVVKGRDQQLEAAVAELLKEIK